MCTFYSTFRMLFISMSPQGTCYGMYPYLMGYAAISKIFS